MSEYIQNIYDRVTNKIITDLEQGVRPWQKPWGGDHAAQNIMRPLRHNGEPYNGVNVLLLWSESVAKGYQNPIWMTYKQAEEYGAHVRKGEKSTFIVYADKITKKETGSSGEDVDRLIPFLRGYNVFNAEQIDGLSEKFLWKPEFPTPASTLKRLEYVEEFVGNTGAIVRHGGNRAFYTECSDYIQMPLMEAFRDTEGYYATLTHELTHWTKHENRLNRDFGRIVRGDEGYAKEELVAEIGSAFLCADLGITPEVRDDHAAYIESWLKALKNDKKLIFSSASHATRAVEFLKLRQNLEETAHRPLTRPRSPLVLSR